VKIVIVGAGIGGLTAALSLLRRGIDVTVLEQAEALGEIGAGLQLSANATRVLYQLDVGEAVAGVAAEPLGKRVRLWNTGQTWPLFDLGTVSRSVYGYPYFTLHRADLHRILAEAVGRLQPDAIRLGQKVLSIEQDDSGVTVLTGHGDIVRGDIAVGADGVHSRVRAALFGPDDPKFSGIIAWRGIAKVTDLPPHMRESYGCNWLGPGAHVVHYPLRSNALVNFVGAVERSGWEVESWSERGRTEDCLDDFAGWHPDVLALIKAIDTPYKWALMVREPMTRWSLGRVTLLGDACHPTLPFLAQGAAMAIEDGYVLARSVMRYPGNPEQALARYEQARLERTSRMVRGSAANAGRFHNPELATAEGAARYVDNEFSEERVKERYEWLFRYDVDAVEI
jgi:salicylate hydroxylase